MCLLRKSKSHLTSKLNQDLKNPPVLTSESLCNEAKCLHFVWSRSVFTCVRSEEAPVGDSHRDHAQHEADDAHEDHGPAVGRLGLPSPGPVPGPRGAWPPIPTSHRTQCILSWTLFYHISFPVSSPRAQSLLHFTVAFWKSNISLLLTADCRVIILFTSRCVAPKSCSQFSHLLEIFLFYFSRFLSVDVWNKINDVDTNWILTPNIKMFLSDDKQCTMFSELARITPRRWKQSVEWGQAVIIFLLRCSVNRPNFLALTCSLILTRLQTKLQ